MLVNATGPGAVSPGAGLQQHHDDDHQDVTAERNGLSVPVLPAAVPTLDAALTYAAAGWYVVPVRAGSKHPGSVLGTGWPVLSSRDRARITAWYAATDHGIALHAGRSGAVVFDVDRPERLPEALKRAEHDRPPPTQTTRDDERRHLVYAMPDGRTLGNSTGGLGGGWGDVRGSNGVIVVAPSEHPDGGRYCWTRTGPVPALPTELAALLPDAGINERAAKSGEVADFERAHAVATSPDPRKPADAPLRQFRERVDRGESRHQAAIAVACWIARDARAGRSAVAAARDGLRDAFVIALAQARDGQRLVGPREAKIEFGLIWSWAVAQALAEQLVDAEQVAGGPAAGAERVAEPSTEASADGVRRVRLRAASGFTMRATDWAWQGRMPLGGLTLIAGREGDGKSTLAYTALADLTRGRLPGDLVGQPRNVAVAATEDSWELTIVPRLVAAGADLDRVFHVEVTRSDGAETVLSLPSDIDGTERALIDERVVALLLDPLMSRLSGRLDTHKDAEVRQALEPLTALADRARAAVVGLIHLNKSGSADPLSAIMASKAFTAVARSVLFVMRDPDDETRHRRLVGLAKANLVAEDAVPTLGFTIESRTVGTDPDTGKAVSTGALVWGEDSARSIRDALSEAGIDPETRTTAAEAADWLHDWLLNQGGTAMREDIVDAARKRRLSVSAIKRAAKALRIEMRSEGFPRHTRWSFPVGSPSSPAQSAQPGDDGDPF